jgi:hypothetical protein
LKAVLRFTDQQLPSLAGKGPAERLLTEGAGLLNTFAAVRLAAALRKDAKSAKPGQRLLNTGISLKDLINDLRLALSDEYGNNAGKKCKGCYAATQSLHRRQYGAGAKIGSR